LVTGGSRGIGAAIAKRLATDGASVAITYAKDASAASAVVKEIEAGGGKAVAIQADAADTEAVKDAVEKAVAALGKLDVLVNNAGVSGSAEQDFYSTEAWHRIMAINATGVFFGIKHAIPAMRAAGGGSIVNLSSIAGIIGSEHVHMAYNASKAAVRLMTKTTAVQHAKDKIRANSVHPGIMPPMRTSGRTADPAVRAERMRVIPMGRPGEVDEVAYAILFLASDESSYITGSEIHVDGGAIAI
jgi:NAD(P)-dependent dehydrogenase (short-subunit alcohol dehydrogenase family)